MLIPTSFRFRRGPLGPLTVLLSLVMLLTGLLAPAVAAQTSSSEGYEVHPAFERGFSAKTAYDLSLDDSVNLFNGSLQVSLPVGPRLLAERGLEYGFTLSFNSSLWRFDTAVQICDDADPGSPRNEALPALPFNAGLGWMVTGPRLFAPGEVPFVDSAQWQLMSADGALHAFHDRLHENDTEALGDGTFYTRDGSYLRLRVLAGGAAEVDSPDGRIDHFDAQRRLTAIRDPFGNEIQVIHTANKEIWQDPHGRRLEIVWETGTGGRRVDEVRVPAFGDAASSPSAVWDFDYATGLALPRPPGDDTCPYDDSVPTTIAADQLLSITRPDGQQYRFEYSPVADTVGLLTAVDLPTGGRTEWSYRVYAFPTVLEPAPFQTQLNGVRGVWTKTQRDADGTFLGRWTYHQKLAYETIDATGRPQVSVTRVAAPENDAVLHHYFDVRPQWSYGLASAPTRPDPQNPSSGRQLAQLSVHPGDSPVFGDSEFPSFPADPLAATYLAYEGDPVPVAEPRKNNHRVVSSRRYSLELANSQAGACAAPSALSPTSAEAIWTQRDRSGFDGLGNFRQTVVTGSRALTPPATVEEGYDATGQSYQVDLSRPEFPAAVFGPYDLPPASAPWLLRTVSSREVRQVGQTLREERCLDPATGALLRTRQLASLAGQRGGGDLVTEITLDAAGRVVAETLYGGDGAGLGTGALCFLALPSPAYRVEYVYQHGHRAATRWVDAQDPGALQVVVEDVDIDAATGLVASSRASSPAVGGGAGALTTTYGYDALGRMVAIDPQQDAPFRYDYTAATGGQGPRLVVERVDGAAALAHQELRFDGFGRVREVLTSRPNQPDPRLGRQRMETRYDGAGRAVFSTVPHLEGAPSAAGSTIEYDLFGRACRSTAADGSVATTRHERGVITRSASILTPTGPTTTNRFETYDDHDRLRIVNELSGPGGTGVNTRYEYDVAGQLTEVRLADGQTEALAQRRTFSYDGRGFMTRSCLPEKGGTGVGQLGCTTYEGFDALGKVATVRQPTAAGGFYDLAFRYDAVGRLVQVRRAPNSGNQASGTPCGGAECRLQDFTYARAHDLGGKLDRRLHRLVRAQQHTDVPDPRDPSQTLRFTVGHSYAYRGPEGRTSRRTTLVTARRGDGSGAFASTEGTYRFDLEVGHDVLGQVTEIHYPRCVQRGCLGADRETLVARTFDQGALTAVGALGADGAYIGDYATFAYHPSGLLARIDHANGLADEVTPDPSGLPRPSRLRLGSASLFDRALHYDSSGRLVALGQDTYRRDPVGRLASATVVSQGEPTTVTYAHDPAGNLVTRTRAGIATTRAVDLGSNRIVDAGFSYDAAGYLTAFDGVTLTRDPFGRVVRSQGAGADRIFVYDTAGERIATYQVGSASQPPEANFTLRGFGAQVLRGYHLAEGGDGTEQWSHHEDLIHRGSRLLVRLRPGAPLGEHRRVHFHLDPLGSPRLLTDATGALLHRRDFLPYGEELNPSAADDGTFRFTGHERDSDGSLSTNLELDYMHARYYSPRLGRFLSLDPAPADPSAPQSWNRYAYVLGDPISYNDPDGLQQTGAQLAEYLESSIQDLKQEITNVVNNGSYFGVSAHTQIGAALDALLLVTDILKLGDSWGAIPSDPDVEGWDNLWLGLEDAGRLAAITGGVGVIARGLRAISGSGSAVAGGAAGTSRPVSSMAPLRNPSGSLDEAASKARIYDPNPVPVNLNNLHHIFGQSKHNLDNFVQSFGSQENAYSALYRATEKVVDGGGPYEAIVDVGGYSVTVRGAVLNGRLRIGTAFIPGS